MSITVNDTKPHKKSPSDDPNNPQFIPNSVYSVHEFFVTGADDDPWLESDERKRAWVPFDEAQARVAWRRGMDEMIARSSLANA